MCVDVAREAECARVSHPFEEGLKVKNGVESIVKSTQIQTHK